jgi:hypothetical protein
MKRILLALALAVSLGGALGACNNGSSTSAPGSSTSGGGGGTSAEPSIGTGGSPSESMAVPSAS